MPAISLLLCQGRNAYIEYAGNSALNTHLALDTLKLPVNKETYEEFAPGAGNGTIEIATGAEACVIAMTLKGIQPDVLPLTQLPRGDRLKMTVFGALVNEYAETAEDREIQVTATAYGRLNAEMGEMAVNMGTDYELRSISKYGLVIRTTEVCRFNVQLGGWQSVGGQRSRINQMIGAV